MLTPTVIVVREILGLSLVKELLHLLAFEQAQEIAKASKLGVWK